MTLLSTSSPQLRGQSTRRVFGRTQVRLLSGTQTFSLPHVRDMVIISFSRKLEVVVTEILWKLEIRFKTELWKIQENPDRGRRHFSLLHRGLLCVVGSEAGEKERESARTTMGTGKREERLRIRTSAFYFSIIAIFTGKPSGNLCGGESSHFGCLDLIGLNTCSKSTWGS